MNRNHQLVLLLIIILSSFKLAFTQINSNEELSANEHLVLATAWYQKSAEMRACYYQAFQLAKIKLDNHLANRVGNKPAAVIFDIDETLLDNSPFEVHLIKSGAIYSKDTWNEWTQKAEAKALPGALEFTQYLKNKGVEVFYISNRKINELEYTLINLKAENFPYADSTHLLLRSMNQSGDKTGRRNQVLQNFDVLLFVGDNLTDFSEDFAHRGTDLGFSMVDSLYKQFGDKYIILPNPMYGEWENAIYGNDLRLSEPKKRALRKEVIIGY